MAHLDKPRLHSDFLGDDVEQAYAELFGAKRVGGVGDNGKDIQTGIYSSLRRRTGFKRRSRRIYQRVRRLARQGYTQQRRSARKYPPSQNTDPKNKIGGDP